jgi:hypothetical protein
VIKTMSDTGADGNALDRVLVLEMVRVTEAAAVAASKLIGRGDEKRPITPRSRRCARG